MFIKPYMQSVLKVTKQTVNRTKRLLQTLMVTLKRGSRRQEVTLSVLSAIGELAKAGGPELQGALDQLLPILLSFLHDASSAAKREVTQKFRENRTFCHRSPCALWVMSCRIPATLSTSTRSTAICWQFFSNYCAPNRRTLYEWRSYACWAYAARLIRTCIV